MLGNLVSVQRLHYCTGNESDCFVSLMCSFIPEDLHSEHILSSLQLGLFRVAVVKRLRVHHHSADYIYSGPLGSLGSFFSQFGNSVPLKPVLVAWAVLHNYIIAHEQIKMKNRVCYFRFFDVFFYQRNFVQNFYI